MNKIERAGESAAVLMVSMSENSAEARDESVSYFGSKWLRLRWILVVGE
jgi:hypothetical protein